MEAKASEALRGFFLVLHFFSPQWCESESLELDEDDDVEVWLVEE
jgi:hypothetical protein